MATGLELIPVGAVVSALCDQLSEIAFAAQDIRTEKSFKQLGDYLNNITKLLLKLDAYTAESPALVAALKTLKDEVDKAERLVTKYRKSSLISNILHCKSICDALQKAMRDIGKALQLLELCNLEVNEYTRNALMLLESEMTQAEVRVPSESLQILDVLQAAIEKDRTDRVIAVELLEKIAWTHGVLPEPRMMHNELSKFEKDIEEAKERKENQEVQYMQQVLSLLSLEDSAKELEASRYSELRDKILKFQDNFSINEPPSQFVCSLTNKVMDDPVMLSTGHTYERKAIQQRFNEDDFTDPASGQPLQECVLRSNHLLDRAIKVWKQQNYAAQILQARNRLLRGVEVEQEKVLCDLSALCKENPDCKDWIVFEGLVPIIVDVMKQRNKDLRALCFSTLQLVVKDNNHAKDKLFESGGLKQIIKNLDRGHTVSRAAISLLLEFIKNRNDVVSKFGQERGAVLLLVTVLLRGNHADMRSEIEQMLDNLSETPDNIEAMVMGNWCKPFIDHLCKGSGKSKLAMANALAKFDLDDIRRESLIEEHVIEDLVDILKSRDIESKLASLKALQNLSSHEKANKHFVESGAVPWLIDSLQRPEQLLKSSAIAILADLTASHEQCFLVDANGSPIEVKEIVVSVIEVVKSLVCLMTRINSVKILLNLAAPSDAHDVRRIIICSDQGLKTFLHLAKCAEAPLRDVSILLLFSLCTDDVDAVSFVRDDQDFPKALPRLIKDNSANISLRAAAAGLLSSIPSNYIGEDVIPALLKMVSEKDLEGQENALGALLRFADSEDIKSQRLLIELGFIENLKHVLRSGKKVAKIKACMALGNISRSTPRLCVEPQRRSFRLSRKSSITCRVHRGRCSLKDTFCIVEAGVMPDIVETLKDQDAEVALAGMDVMETLLEGDMHVNGVKILHEFEAIENLFPLVNMDSDSCSEKCVDLFNIILKVPDMKKIYGQRVQRTLTALFASRTSTLQQKALKLFRDLTD